MGENPSNPLIYLRLAAKDSNALANIRHWDNLKIGFQENFVWVKNISDGQSKSVEIQSLPSKQLYYEKEQQLYLYGSLLPDCNIPSVLWSDISRGLPLHLPIFNHNFFGIKEKISIKIIHTEKEQNSAAMLSELKYLKPYIPNAPAIRLKGLLWTILEEKALILGQPILPIPGKTFWRKGYFLIPTGYDFNHPSLADVINQQINPNNSHWVLWNEDSTCLLIKKSKIRTLSISSFKRSVSNPNPNKP